MKRYKRATADSEPQINLTPLIDVVFVILIVFVLVAPLLKLENIALAAGASSSTTQSVRNSSPITVYVRDDDTVWLGEARVDLHRLTAALTQAKLDHPATTPQLVQDRNSHFGQYQAVKNAFEEAGFEEIELILQAGG